MNRDENGEYSVIFGRYMVKLIYILIGDELYLFKLLMYFEVVVVILISL